MNEDTKDLVTGANDASEDALINDISSFVAKVTVEQDEEGNAEGKGQIKESKSASKESPEEADPVEALRAELAEARRQAADSEKAKKAAQAKMFEALQERNSGKGSSKAETTKVVEGDDGDESDESDVVADLYRKHFDRLSKKFPDEDESVLRSRASHRAYKDYFDMAADKKARALLENSPAAQAYEETLVNEKCRSVAEFVVSRPELKDPNSEVYKMTDQLFAEKLRLIGAAEGKEYIKFNDDGSVVVQRSAHKNLDTKDLLSASFYEAIGRLGGEVPRKDKKAPSVARSGNNGRFEKPSRDYDNIKSEGDLIDFVLS